MDLVIYAERSAVSDPVFWVQSAAALAALLAAFFAWRSAASSAKTSKLMHADLDDARRVRQQQLLASIAAKIEDIYADHLVNQWTAHHNELEAMASMAPFSLDATLALAKSGRDDRGDLFAAAREEVRALSRGIGWPAA